MSLVICQRPLGSLIRRGSCVQPLICASSCGAGARMLGVVGGQIAHAPTIAPALGASRRCARRKANLRRNLNLTRTDLCITRM